VCAVWGVGRADEPPGKPYFGQQLPGSKPTLFAPGIVSLPNRSEIRVAFSPDGRECFFTQSSPDNAYPWRLLATKLVDDAWTPPEPAAFHPRQGKFTGQPFFSADGNTLTFTSDADGTTHLWTVRRTPQGWGAPQRLPAPINVSDGNSVYGSSTLDGTLYFASNRPGQGNLDVWRARKGPGPSLEVENLGPPINTPDYDYDPFVDPQGRYLLFARAGAVFVCYSDGRDGWRAPVNMDDVIPDFNLGGADGPSVSPDGKYLFWRRYSGGQPDIYWVENNILRRSPTQP